MTDIQINIALAKAMGWRDDDISTGVFSQGLAAYDCNTGCWRKFDYSNPVIFVAICKHWELSVHYDQLVCYCLPTLEDFLGDTIEKAAAMCVIETAKRGVL